MRNLISATLLGLLAALLVIAAEPGHTRYQPHQLLPKPHVHAVLARFDRTVNRLEATDS